MVNAVEKLFSENVRNIIRQRIKDADGNEVFFAGQIDSDGKLVSVQDYAHGNEHAVPVHQEAARKCSVLVHNHPSGVLKPSDADIAVACENAEFGIGSYIVNNDVSEVYVIVEPVLPKIIKKIDEQEAAQYLGEGGPLSVLSENYEERPVQLELLKSIARSFNQSSVGVFEAGTGVGKSFAYLIPSVIWSLENNEKVVVSTGTINLQQQLVEKDLPFVSKILGRKFKYILMKGRQNYVCKRRFEEAGATRDLFSDDNEVFDKIADWVSVTSSGSRSELSFIPPENLWSRINSESDSCMGGRCPFHSDCFVMKVRKEAAGSNILVVNHHLLFADIESRMHSGSYNDAAVLPPYRHIVFDEAHGVESAATSFFSENFNRFKVLKQINLLYRKRKNTETGYLCTLAILSSNEDKAITAYELINSIKTSISNLEVAANDLIQGEYNVRLSQKTCRAFGPVITLASTLASNIGRFVDLSREVMEGVNDEDKDIPAYFETKVLLRRLEDACVVLNDFASWDEKPENVFWIQKKALFATAAKDSANPFYIVFNETPLDIAPLMNAGVYEPMKSVICTSATLKTGRDFGYWMRRAGVSFVDGERVAYRDFPSPFPYKKNMLFAVPKDAPFPDDVTFQTFVEKALVKLIDAAQGRSLVLFTSYDSLRKSYSSVSSCLHGFDGKLLRQGMDDNARLLDVFRKEVNSVLFATDSFWQGVDVPGESLSQVIIVKLPFLVPNDPVFTARSEAIEAKGGSSFMELSVPEAVIKFRQGVGRLMRRGTDRGSVVVLDRRLYEKRYGSIFLNSLPECKRVYENLDSICDKVSHLIFN